MRALASFLALVALTFSQPVLALDPAKTPPITIGIGSTGDASAVGVTANGVTLPLSSVLGAVQGNTAAISTEGARAKAAEALLAPLLNPSFAGFVTAPRLTLTGPGSTGDASAMSVTANGSTLSLGATLGSVQANTTAIGNETARAVAAENLLAPRANPTFTGLATTPALKITGSGSTGDVSGMSVTANGATQLLSAISGSVQSNSAAISSEAGRAQAAEALLAPVANPTFTGLLSAPKLTVTASGSTGDVSGMSVLGRTLADRARDSIKVIDAPYSAACDGRTLDTAALNSAFAAALAGNKDLELPAGKTCVSGALSWDVTSAATTGMRLRSSGGTMRGTTLDLTSVTSGTAFAIYSTKDWYSFGISDIRILGNTPGTVLKIGKDDFTDPLNNGVFDNVMVANTSQSATAEAWRLNYVLNSNFIGAIGNGYANGAGANYGRALVCRQCDFNTFANGSFGNASYAISFLDGISYGNVFLAVDVENVNIGWYSGTANHGGTTVIGGQLSLWQQFGIQSPAAAGNGAFDFYNTNYTTPTNVLDPSNLAGVRMHDAAPVTTPAMPASGASAKNTTGKNVLVVWWGGNATAITVNGFNIGLPQGSLIVPAGGTVGFPSYTTAPVWTWQAAG